ncbi:MAG: VOC family protein [Acidobacteria bacterium]|nr:VOC family protein [Acidobacteriota bacterium]MBI3422251.1 VOC family protein [Acidobacteriota bacterium]
MPPSMSTAAATSGPVISAIKSAVIRVQTIEQARPFYEKLLGLQALSETDMLTDKTRRLWGLNARQVRCLRLGKPGDNFGMLDLVELTGQTSEPLRNPNRPWDYGWFTLNLKTNHLDRAIEAVRDLGALTISAPHSYEAGGKQIREVMINLVSGERLTLLQVGPVDETAPLFGEPLATMGAVVPSLAESLAFYRDALGLGVAVTLDQTGEPFATMLGMPASTRVQMALLTSGGNWTGKFELLQLTPPPGTPPALDRNRDADGMRLGFWMMSVMTPDVDQLQAACRHAGVSVIRGPATIDRPCYGRVKALVIRAPGGELLECMAPATGPVSSR